MFGKSKSGPAKPKGLELLVASIGKKARGEDEAPTGDEMEREEEDSGGDEMAGAVAEDMLDAFKRGDSEQLSKAIKNLIAACKHE